MKMSQLFDSSAQYGIISPGEIIYNPDYDLLFSEVTHPKLTGYEAGAITELGAISVNTGIFTGRSTT